MRLQTPNGGVRLGDAKIPHMIYGDDVTIMHQTFDISRKVSSDLGPELAVAGGRLNNKKSSYAAPNNGEPIQNMSIPALNTKGKFVMMELVTVLPETQTDPSTNDHQDKEQEQLFFKYLGALMQTGTTEQTGAWGAQEKRLKASGAKFVIAAKAIAFTTTEYSTAVASCLFPKTGFILGQLYANDSWAQYLKQVAATGRLAQSGVHIGQNDTLSTDIACLATNGPYLGLGVPDPRPWLVSRHVLDYRLALSYPPSSAVYQSVATPLKHIRDYPNDTTSFPAARNVLTYLARNNIQFHTGLNTQIQPLEVQTSKRGHHLSILSRLPTRYLWRALSNAEHLQLLNNLDLYQSASFGAPFEKEACSYDHAIIHGSYKRTGHTSYSVSPYPAAHFAADGIKKNNEGTMVLIDSQTISGHIQPLWNKDHRQEANLSERASFYAARAQETLAPEQYINPESILGYDRTSILTEGITPHTKFDDIHRDLSDKAIAALVKMIPDKILKTPIPLHPGQDQRLLIHSDASISTSAIGGDISKRIPPLETQNPVSTVNTNRQKHTEDLRQFLQTGAPILIWLATPKEWILSTIQWENIEQHLSLTAPLHIRNIYFSHLNIMKSTSYLQTMANPNQDYSKPFITHPAQLQSLSNLITAPGYFKLPSWPPTNIQLPQAPHQGPTPISFINKTFLSVIETVSTMGNTGWNAWTRDCGFTETLPNTTQLKQWSSAHTFNNQLFQKIFHMAKQFSHSLKTRPTCRSAHEVLCCLKLGQDDNPPPCRRTTHPTNQLQWDKAYNSLVNEDPKIPGKRCACTRSFTSENEREAHTLGSQFGEHGIPSDELPVNSVAVLIESPLTLEDSTAAIALVKQNGVSPHSSAYVEGTGMALVWTNARAYHDQRILSASGSLDAQSALQAVKTGRPPPYKRRTFLKNKLHHLGGHVSDIIMETATGKIGILTMSTLERHTM